ncbi:restriction endonuclease subunit S [Thermoactinomyces sp. CICC 10523]|uniref:restriction endonuclease subunit S n=1 Tax=Thermoactinomyces sp. CICC 10523 TaxID=2767428 RepID=UPI0018DB33DC|nr:restriction endonuclease subunit S [Thermoactinomyces sp. CICC 10523]MBH8599639.1 restriction endonuclease subunit S [Thermoactinomyces sp. CICC 10523]
MSFEEWKTIKLGDVCEVKGGKRLPKGHSLISQKTKYPYIRVKDFGDLKPNLEGLQYLHEDTYKKLKRYTISKDDIYISIVGTIGLIGKVGNCLDGSVLTENAARIIIKNKQVIDRDFLLYYLSSPKGQNEISKQVVGSTQPKLALFRIKEFEIMLPSLKEQNKIAETLSSLDEKIELNNQINKNLEEMAQAIFKSWFVDFEPFQDGEFVESEFGMIPKGWEVKKIEEVCLRVNSGGTPKRSNKEFYNGSILWLKTKELTDGFVFDTEEKITEEAVLNSSAKFFPKNTVLIALYGATVGKLGILTRDTTFNQATCGMVVDEKYICHVYLYLTLLLNRDFIKSMATGSAQQNLSVSIIKNMKIIIPEPDVMKMFTNTVKPLYEKIKANQYESICLKNLRDTLLPKLMSGEIRVPLENEGRHQDEQLQRV